MEKPVFVPRGLLIEVDDERWIQLAGGIENKALSLSKVLTHYLKIISPN